MRKKLFNIFIFSLVIVLSIPTVCFASRHSTNVTKLTNLCEYHGWYIDNASFDKNCAKFTAITDVGDAGYYTAKMKVKTAKKNGKYRSTYYVQGERYPLKSIEKMLKKYSTPYGRDVVLSQKAADAVDGLVDYGEKLGWTTEVAEADNYSEVMFSNKKYYFNVSAYASRNAKQKKITITYKRDGKDSTKSAIKEWLEKYSITA